jgi:ABC-type transport system involved in multi-copper enzyme maturation permease subunit
MNEQTQVDQASSQQVTLSPCRPVTLSPSLWRAWCFLVRVSWQRQARAHLMVWVALGLLAITLFMVIVHGHLGGWDVGSFSRVVMLGMYCGFLLPMWSLSFATEALGRERESRNLVWVLTRPLSRPAIYLAKLIAVLPWCLGFNLGGFALICLVAGEAGMIALGLYWPAVVAGTVAYCTLFHLMGAWFRRASVVAVLYSFFLETFMGFMPGYWKRASISFYTRCLMFESGAPYGVQPRDPFNYIPVSSITALWVLAAAMVLFLAGGMVVFTRSEYLDLN